MKRLTKKQDPTGFLNLFRMVASTWFGNPVGHIESHGRYGGHTKKGPGRRHMGPWNLAGSKLWRKIMKRQEK